MTHPGHWSNGQVPLSRQGGPKIVCKPRSNPVPLPAGIYDATPGLSQYSPQPEKSNLRSPNRQKIHILFSPLYMHQNSSQQTKRQYVATANQRPFLSKIQKHFVDDCGQILKEK